ncbi:unnamed protein product [Rotaria sordida]|uniref:Uncharacterized protein n=1 Tax=Rotaria sordida TaxID=392033 RepID=A0A818WFA5_9BILA|nr:unnamed protein product [Rotaria sordida]
MHIQKRTISYDTGDDPSQKSSILKEQKNHKYWRRFMNERAIDRAYVPTTHEHVANCLTHGCLIIPSFIAAQRLISHVKTPAQYWSSIIYGSALIFLFSSSTCFHCSCFHPTYRDSTLKHLLHRVDRAIIYIFISASYTPWLLLRPIQAIPTIFTVALVWIMAILGITYQILYHERHKWLETCFYVGVGVFPAIVITDMALIIAAGDNTSTSERTSALLARALRFGDALVARAVFADLTFFVGYIRKSKMRH